MYRTVSMAVQLWHISTLAQRMQVSMWVNVVIPAKNATQFMAKPLPAHWVNPASRGSSSSTMGRRTIPLKSPPASAIDG